MLSMMESVFSFLAPMAGLIIPIMMVAALVMLSVATAAVVSIFDK